MKFFLSVCAALVLVSSVTAQTPNWGASPYYGTVNLTADFAPDPTTKDVNAGGVTRNPIDGPGCTGYLTMTAPDLDLNFTAGDLPLTISAVSDQDVSLLVYTPGGQWLCDDDSGDGTDPLLRMAAPESGNYNIWVATYNETSERPEACVSFSELGRSCESGGAGEGSALNWQADPTYGTINLASGFSPDPTVQAVSAGGSSANPLSGPGCAGYLALNAPDVDLNFQAGDLPLTISAASSDDVAMVVYTPRGEWLCDDDSGDGTNPKITLESPTSGNYNIWIATYSATDDRPLSQVAFSEVGRTATAGKGK